MASIGSMLLLTVTRFVPAGLSLLEKLPAMKLESGLISEGEIYPSIDGTYSWPIFAVNDITTSKAFEDFEFVHGALVY